MALTQQGFVAEEPRGNRRRYKLRFRRDGRQTVRYVGSAERAEAVKRELNQLQQDVQLERELKAWVKRTNQRLREAKRQLEPLLNAQGFAFHGQAIRKPRTKPAE